MSTISTNEVSKKTYSNFLYLDKTDLYIFFHIRMIELIGFYFEQ